MVGNDKIKNTFGKIELKRFVGFSGWSRWKEKTIGSNGLEKNGRNDRALPINNGQEGWVFHLHGNC